MAAAPAAALPEVPRLGISLAALSAFCGEHAGRVFAPAQAELEQAAQSGTPAPAPLRFEELTTTQVRGWRGGGEAGTTVQRRADAAPAACERRRWYSA
jgi:hypothetical protein